MPSDNLQNTPGIVEHCCSALNASSQDISQFIESGAIREFAGAPAPGFAPICTVGNRIVYGNAFVRYKYLSYADELQKIRTEINVGRGNLGYILNKLRNAQAPTGVKAKAMGLESRYGIESVFQPFFGNLVRMPTHMCLPFHHFAFQQILLESLSQTVDTIFEMGAGIGDSLVELAYRTPWPEVRLVGGEIAQNGKAAMVELAGLINRKDLITVDFDVFDPDFSAVASSKHAFFFSQFALVYCNPFPDSFFETMFDSCPRITAVFLEPFGYELVNRFGHKPVFDLKRARSYGLCEDFWSKIEAVEKKGKIKVRRVMPDYAGKTLLSASSLVVLEKT